MSGTGPAYEAPPPRGDDKMRPLTLVVLGFLLVIADLTTGGFDLLPDPIGWILVVLGLSPLTPRHRGFVIAFWTAVALVPLSLLLLSAEDLLGGAWQRLLSLVDVLTTFTVQAGILVAVRSLTRFESSRRIASLALTGASVAALLGVGAALFGPGERQQVSGAPGLLLGLVLLVGLVLLLAALIWLYRVGREREFDR